LRSWKRWRNSKTDFGAGCRWQPGGLRCHLYSGIVDGVLKTLALEEIYADPHKLDSYLVSGEPVTVVRNGQPVAEFVPHKAGVEIAGAEGLPRIDFRARFLKMWGPNAFKSEISVADQFEELRQPRG
jgi:hypothetical protein